MIKTIYAAAIALALAAPAFANPGNGGNPCGGNCGNGGNQGGSFEGGITGGAFGGVAHSVSRGGSFAASGGLAAGGANGGSFVRQENSAGQLAGAHASFDRSINGGKIEGTLVTETFSDGFSETRTNVRNHGTGTIGAGAGFSTNWGEAEASGAFGGAGFSSRW